MLLGLATAVSIKAVLLAPVVLALAFHGAQWRAALLRLLWLGLAATATLALALGLHHLTMPALEAPDPAASSVRGAWEKTIRDSPWFPRLSALQGIYLEDHSLWLIAGAGVGWSIWRRHWGVAACALALLPVVFYRNAYPYYFVVMWGPACVAVAAAAAGLEQLAQKMRPAARPLAMLALAAWVLAHGAQQLPFLSIPRQAEQAQLVAAVHEVFPTPVPYVDHSGMIASFPKANFFMSSWGMEQYLARGQPFMPRAISRLRPPLLVANRSELMSGTRVSPRLLPEDRQLIECCYQPYWGAIYIAGAAGSVGTSPLQLRVPFAGDYRVEAPGAVRVAGQRVAPGDVVTLAGDRVQVQVDAADRPGSAPVEVRLLWAQARPPPSRTPPDLPRFYDSL